MADEDDRDRELLRRIATGDRVAYEMFYRRHVNLVAAFVRTLCAARDVDDVTAETMIGAWRSAARYRGDARPAVWLLAIAHHRAVDARRAVRSTVVSLDAAANLSALDGDPAEAALRSARVRELDAALGQLTPRHRTVLELMYTFDRTQAEIATIVDAPLATVKTRVFHAKRKLREALSRTTDVAR